MFITTRNLRKKWCGFHLNERPPEVPSTERTLNVVRSASFAYRVSSELVKSKRSKDQNLLGSCATWSWLHIYFIICLRNACFAHACFGRCVCVCAFCMLNRLQHGMELSIYLHCYHHRIAPKICSDQICNSATNVMCKQLIVNWECQHLPTTRWMDSSTWSTGSRNMWIIKSQNRNYLP